MFISNQPHEHSCFVVSIGPLTVAEKYVIMCKDFNKLFSKSFSKSTHSVESKKILWSVKSGPKRMHCKFHNATGSKFIYFSCKITLFETISIIFYLKFCRLRTSAFITELNCLQIDRIHFPLKNRQQTQTHGYT